MTNPNFFSGSYKLDENAKQVLIAKNINTAKAHLYTYDSKIEIAFAAKTDCLLQRVKQIELLRQQQKPEAIIALHEQFYTKAIALIDITLVHCCRYTAAYQENSTQIMIEALKLIYFNFTPYTAPQNIDNICNPLYKLIQNIDQQAQHNAKQPAPQSPVVLSGVAGGLVSSYFIEFFSNNINVLLAFGLASSVVTMVIMKLLLDANEHLQNVMSVYDFSRTAREFRAIAKLVYALKTVELSPAQVQTLIEAYQKDNSDNRLTPNPLGM